MNKLKLLLQIRMGADALLGPAEVLGEALDHHRRAHPVQLEDRGIAVLHHERRVYVELHRPAGHELPQRHNSKWRHLDGEI